MDLESQPGVHCSLSTCSRISFLPINCLDCSLAFCEQHYLPDQHSCANPDHSNQKTLTDQELASRLLQRNSNRGQLSGRLPCQAAKCNNLSLKVQVQDEQGQVQHQAAEAQKAQFTHKPPRCERCKAFFCMSHRSPTSHACKAPTPPTEGNLIRAEKNAKKEKMKALLEKNFPKRT